MAWLSQQTGQSAADLLAVPATVYGAIRSRVIEQIRALEVAAHRAERQDQWDGLLDSLRARGAS